MTKAPCTIAHDIGTISVLDFCIAPLWIICRILHESDTQNVALMVQLVR